MKRKYPTKHLVVYNTVGVAENEAAVRKLGYPDISACKTVAKGHLAIVGGGPSINHRKAALRSWKGDVWAVNHAALWCARNDIPCALFTIDPAPGPYDPALTDNINWAILATRVHPNLFALVKHACIHTFETDETDIEGGSASTAVLVALKMGYEHFTFFGCEGSFAPGGKHHAYDEVEEKECLIQANGEKFLTEPGYLFTAFVIAKMIRQYPQHVSERSGGLLSALVKDLDYELIGVSPAMATPNTPQEFLDEYKEFVEAL